MRKAVAGYGPRLPYMVISPFAKENYVSHVMTDQSSTIRFIEDNWLGGQRIGNGSFDAIAGTINDMFDFSHPQTTKLVLNSIYRRAQVVGSPLSLTKFVAYESRLCLGNHRPA